MLAPNILPRSLKQATITFAGFCLFCWLLLLHWQRPSIRTIQFSAFEGHIASPEDAAQLCAAHNFPPVATAHSRDPHERRRVYDLFLLNTELDWLEIRLNTLYQYVDYFVIVESERTFTGIPKSLHLYEHWSDFETFHRKIIHIVVDDKVNSTVSWDHEDAFRDALLYETAAQINGTERMFREGDALVVSDADEVIRPETVNLLRYCDYPDRLTLRSRFYSYSFQWLHRGEQWAHPQATVYRGLESTIPPSELRSGEGEQGWSLFSRRQKAEISDAGWHCASCFRTIKEVQTKMQSFSPSVWNTAENRDPKTIIERVRNGLDLFGHEGGSYEKIQGNLDMPKFILETWHRYRFLLNRNGEDAGFEDAKEMTKISI